MTNRTPNGGFGVPPSGGLSSLKGRAARGEAAVKAGLQTGNILIHSLVNGYSSCVARIKTFRVLKFVLTPLKLLGLPRDAAFGEFFFGNLVFGFPTVLADSTDIRQNSRSMRTLVVHFVTESSVSRVQRAPCANEKAPTP